MILSPGPVQLKAYSCHSGLIENTMPIVSAMQATVQPNEIAMMTQNQSMPSLETPCNSTEKSVRCDDRIVACESVVDTTLVPREDHREPVQ